ncbi:MAG: hypothetical protein ACI9OJ_001263 [Myxococcota bacterium]
MTPLIDGRQSYWFAPLMIAAGLLSVGAGIWSLMVGSDVGIMERFLGGLFPMILGALFVSGGQMLASRRGGIFVDTEAVALQGDGDHDRLRVPTTDIIGVYVFELVERWGTEVHAKWVCEASLRSGGRLLLGESTDERGLRHYAHRFTDAAGCAGPSDGAPDAARQAAQRRRGAVTQPSESISRSSDTITLSVGSRGRLARTLWVSAISMLGVGVLLLVDLANNDVMGFLFGPLLTAIGLSLLILQVSKARLLEHIRFFEGELGHGYEAFGFRWGWQTLALESDAYVRLRQRGLLGASLEVVSGGRIRHMAGGVHTGTRVTHADLRWLAGEFETRIATVAAPRELDAPDSDAPDSAASDSAASDSGPESSDVPSA